MRHLMISAMTAAVVLAAGTSEAREATVSDFAICNREAAGATGSAPLASPGSPAPPAPGREPQRGNPDPATPAPPSAGPGYRTEAGRTDPTGSLIARPEDPLLRGMAAEHADDDQYRVAYRTCMASRGVSADGPGR